MVNNPAGYEALKPNGRGGAGDAGLRRRGRIPGGDTVKYVVLPRLLQPTTIGEPRGRETPRIRAARAAIRSAGFPVAINRDMDA